MGGRLSGHRALQCACRVRVNTDVPVQPVHETCGASHDRLRQPPENHAADNDIKILQNLLILTTRSAAMPKCADGDGPRRRQGPPKPSTHRQHSGLCVRRTGADPRNAGIEYYANASRHGRSAEWRLSASRSDINGFYPVKNRKNYLAGAQLSRYPAGTLNVVPFEAQFVDVPNGDYRVRDGSPLKGVAPPDPRFCYLPEGCTNADIGADIATLVTRIADVRPGPPDNVPGAPRRCAP